MIDPITRLSVSLSSIDSAQRIDVNREWAPINIDQDAGSDQFVFIGFYAGDSPPLAGEIEYTDVRFKEEAFWVYKTDYTIAELLDDDITPQELFNELMEEQPNIEIAGLCKYVRDIPPE